MKILSSEFEQNQQIPLRYTCEGEGINPPLQFDEVNSGARSLALIVDDPDAPSGNFTHWTVANIDPKVTEISEDSVPEGAVQGENNGGGVGYVPPCPPSGQHRYFFKLYALKNKLNLNQGFSRRELEEAIEKEKIEEAHLIGLYQKKEQ